MDLGHKEKAPGVTVPSGKGESKIVFPSFSVRNDNADSIRNDYECKVESTGTATIKFKVVGDTKDKYSNFVQFDVLSMDITKYNGPKGEKEKDEGEKEKDEDEGEKAADEAEEKVLGYKRPKSNKPAPSTNAADLTE